MKKAPVRAAISPYTDAFSLDEKRSSTKFVVAHTRLLTKC